MTTGWLQPIDSVLSVERIVLARSGPAETETDRGVIRPRSTADWDRAFHSAAGFANHLVAKKSFVRWDKPIGASWLAPSLVGDGKVPFLPFELERGRVWQSEWVHFWTRRLQRGCLKTA